MEFVEPEAVQEALLLNESELHGRQLKVNQIVPKSTVYMVDTFEHGLLFGYRRLNYRRIKTKVEDNSSFDLYS